MAPETQHRQQYRVEINVNQATYGLAGLAHELKHGYQFETGNTDFNSHEDRGVLHDIYDEVSAYKRQFAVSGQNMSTANADYVRGLKDSNGKSIYGSLPGLILNTSSSLLLIQMSHLVSRDGAMYNASIGILLQNNIQYTDNTNSIYNK